MLAVVKNSTLVLAAMALVSTSAFAGGARGPRPSRTHTLKCKGEGHLERARGPVFRSGDFEADIRFFDIGNPDVFVVGFAGSQRFFPSEVSHTEIREGNQYIYAGPQYTEPTWAASGSMFEGIVFAAPAKLVPGTKVKASMQARLLYVNGARDNLFVPEFNCVVK